MAFRLQSFAAGAAKRGSERLKEMETDMKERVKTSATTIATQMQDTVKKRTESATGYKRAAKNLKSRYRLSDAQVQVLLSGGLDNATAFENTIKQGEMKAFNAGVEFDRDAFIADRFTIDDNLAALDIEAQAQAFAAEEAPQLTSGLIGQQAGQIAESTRSILGGLSPEAARAMIQAEVTARGGAPIQDYTGTELANLGSVKLADMTVEEMLGVQKLKADIAGQEATTQQTLNEIKVSDAMLPVDIAEAKARTGQIAAAAGLDNARANEINALLPTKKQLSEAQIANVYQNIKQSDATITKMVQDGKVSEANVGLITQQIAKLSVDTETAEMLQGLSVRELEATISSIEAATTLSGKRAEMLDKDISWADERAEAEVNRINGLIKSEGITAEKMQTELDLLNKFGEQDKQAALDLIEAKILQAGNFDDLEAFQVSLMGENKRLEEQIAALPDTEDANAVRDSLQNQIEANNARIASSTVALSGTGGFQELLNKGQAPTVYNHVINQNLQGFGIDQQFSSLDAVIGNLEEGQYPQYFGAVINGIKEFDEVYGKDRQGYAFATQKMNSMNNMLADYARRIGEPVDTTGLTGSKLRQANAQNNLASMNLGRMTLEEIGQHEGTEGEVVSYVDPNTEEVTYAIFTGGTFVSAKF